MVRFEGKSPYDVVIVVGGADVVGGRAELSSPESLVCLSVWKDTICVILCRDLHLTIIKVRPSGRIGLQNYNKKNRLIQIVLTITLILLRDDIDDHHLKVKQI